MVAPVLAGLLGAGCATRGILYPLGRAEGGQGYVDLYEFYATEDGFGTYWKGFQLDCAPTAGGVARPFAYRKPLTRLALAPGRYRFSGNGIAFQTDVEAGRIKACCIYTFRDTARTSHFGTYYTVTVNCRVRDVCSVTDPAVDAAQCRRELVELLRSGVELKQYYACMLLQRFGDRESVAALEALKAQDDRFRRPVDRAIAAIRSRARMGG